MFVVAVSCSVFAVFIISLWGYVCIRSVTTAGTTRQYPGVTEPVSLAPGDEKALALSGLSNAFVCCLSFFFFLVVLAQLHLSVL